MLVLTYVPWPTQGNTVYFSNGVAKEFDAVVLCTGYDIATTPTAHPYLASHIDQGLKKLDFYLGCFLPDLPGCGFVGGCFGFAAVPRIAELQSKAIVNVLTGVKSLPSPEEMKKNIARVLKFPVQKVWP